MQNQGLGLWATVQESTKVRKFVQKPKWWAPGSVSKWWAPGSDHKLKLQIKLVFSIASCNFARYVYSFFWEQHLPPPPPPALPPPPPPTVLVSIKRWVQYCSRLSHLICLLYVMSHVSYMSWLGGMKGDESGSHVHGLLRRCIHTGQSESSVWYHDGIAIVCIPKAFFCVWVVGWGVLFHFRGSFTDSWVTFTKSVIHQMCVIPAPYLTQST